jgi:fructose-1,6-bisphosphatase I
MLGASSILTAEAGMPVTLEQHLRALQGDEARSLDAVLLHIAGAGKCIAAELNRAALVGQLGTTGATNVQGEAVKKLDVWSNDVMIEALTQSGLACTMVSEEMAEPLHLDAACPNGRYVVFVDPVDGSSNLDINGIVGTIFSVRRRTYAPDHLAADVLSAGTEQVAAGYIMYGPATLLVLTTGDGVNAFSLERGSDRFTLFKAAIRIPPRGRIYSINEANALKWEPGVRELIDHLRSGAAGRTYTARYVGSLVADFHRTLLEGGLFMYPAEKMTSGKLRLQYECAPVAFIAEQAGGAASTGHAPVMDVKPVSHHERVPLVVGSVDDVRLAEDFIRRG